ncbi:MAG: hypothetical protein Q8Q02_14245 [Nocardioides sp.]|nr:hypothetical protein [Nocardioides sp.]
MSVITRPDPGSPGHPLLTALDRCDAPTTGADGIRLPCGAAAQHRVLLPSGLDLVFCGHHEREYADRLAGLGAVAAGSR